MTGRIGWRTLAPAGLLLILAAGCGSTGHSAAAPSTGPSASVITAAPVTAPASAGTSVSGATSGDQSAQLAAVEQDLAGAGTADSQAATDMNAAAAAQAQNDNG